MVSNIQKTNPIKSSIFLACNNKHQTGGLYYTHNYGRASGILNLLLGDGSTASTIPNLKTPKGFEFIDGYYINTDSLSLGTAWTISMVFNYNGGNDEYLVGFSSGGGIIMRDTAATNYLTYYDGTSRISSGVELTSGRVYNISITKSAANAVKIYFDGVLKGSGNGTVSSTVMNRIGCDGYNLHYYNGLLLEFATFKYEFDSTQVGNIKNRYSREIVTVIPSDNISSLVQKNDGFYFDLSDSTKLTLNTQPTPDDWDMERSDTIKWTNFLATFSKQTDSPPVGTRYGRVTWTNQTVPAAYQPTVFVNGNRYLVDYYGRGDGVNAPRLELGSGTGDNISGTASNSWQHITGDGSANGGTQLAIRKVGIASTSGNCDFDAITLQNISVNAIAPKALGNSFSGLTLAQGTAAQMPWKSTTSFNGRNPVQFDGTEDNLSTGPSGVNKSKFSFLSYESTVIYIIIPNPSQTDSLWLFFTSLGAEAGYALSPPSNVNPLRIQIYAHNGSSTVTNVVTADVLVANQPNIVVGRLSASQNLVNVRINGSQKINTTPANPPLSVTPTRDLYIAGYNTSYNYTGSMGDIMAFSKCMTDSEVQSIERYLATKWGIAI